MKTLNYSNENKKYSIGQLRQVPEYLALINADAESKNGIQTCLKYILDSIDIDKAEGFLLDYIGWLVGITREYFDTDQYFSINRADVNTEKYIWFSEPQSDYVVPAGRLEDINFRARIKAKAGANTSRCTREENIKIIKDMVFADKVIIENVSPLTLDITLQGSNILTTPSIRQDIEAILGNGVGLRNLTVENS